MSKIEQILNEVKEVNNNGKTELFSKVYIDFKEDKTYEITDYFEAMGMFVSWMFGGDHDIYGGYVYLDWHSCDCI